MSKQGDYFFSIYIVLFLMKNSMFVIWLLHIYCKPSRDMLDCKQGICYIQKGKNKLGLDWICLRV